MTRRGRYRLALGVALTISVAAVVGALVGALPGRGVVRPLPSDAQASAHADPAFDRYFHAGVQLLRAGRAAEAAAAFDAARARRPRQPEVHANLGFAHLALGKHDRALEHFLAAIEYRPAQANAYFGLAAGLAELGDHAGALGAMRTYLHLTPPGDRFRRKAEAAVWELSELVALRRRGQAAAPPDEAGIP